MFVAPNAPYGVDECLARGTGCRMVVANAFCQSRQFASAASFGRAEPTDVTGALQSVSSGRIPGAYVAIACRR